MNLSTTPIRPSPEEECSAEGVLKAAALLTTIRRNHHNSNNNNNNDSTSTTTCSLFNRTISTSISSTSSSPKKTNKKNPQQQEKFLVVKTKTATTRRAASSYSYRDVGPFKKNKTIAITPPRYCTSPPPPPNQDHNENVVPTTSIPRTRKGVSVNPTEEQQERPTKHHLHQRHEEILHYNSSFLVAEQSRGTTFNKSNSSLSALLINVAATARTTRNGQGQKQVAPPFLTPEPTRQPLSGGNGDQQVLAPMQQQPRQDTTSDVNHAMEAAQRLYYQRMVDSNARDQKGHFAMMFRLRHQTPPTTMITQLQPPTQQRHSSFVVYNTSPTVPNTRDSAESKVPATQFVDGKNVQQLRHLLTPQDRHLTTQFTVNIIDQLDFVYFEKGDRRSHRTHLPIGFQGICCRHCKAAPGKSGRYFPSSLKTLSDTQKTLFTLHRHFMKCRKTPDCVKQTLQKLRDSHLSDRKILKCHGSQRAFFRRVWGFLCPEAEGDSIVTCAIEKTKNAKDGKKM